MAIKTKKATTKKAPAEAVNSQVVADYDQTNRDFMLAMLIVSVTVNLFVLIGWVALQVTNIYDAEVAAFLFTK